MDQIKSSLSTFFANQVQVIKNGISSQQQTPHETEESKTSTLYTMEEIKLFNNTSKNDSFMLNTENQI